VESEELALAEAELRFVRQNVDPELSLAHYKRTAAMRITGEWMQPFVARASFNLGYMYQFGVGMPRDTHLARRYYRRCFEVDPAGVQVPVTMMLLLLSGQVYLLDLPPAQELAEALLGDLRTHVLAIIIILLGVLLHTRYSLIRTRPMAASRNAAGGSSSTDGVLAGSSSTNASGEAVNRGDGAGDVRAMMREMIAEIAEADEGDEY